MAKEKLFSSLGNLGLQRHLIGVPIPTLEAAVRAGNEYPQLTATHSGGKPPGRHTYQVMGESPLVEVIAPVSQVAVGREGSLEALHKILADLGQADGTARPSMQAGPYWSSPTCP